MAVDEVNFVKFFVIDGGIFLNFMGVVGRAHDRCFHWVKYYNWAMAYSNHNLGDDFFPFFRNYHGRRYNYLQIHRVLNS